MDFLKIYKQYIFVLSIFGCFGFQINHRRRTIKFSYWKCIYAIPMYFCLGFLIFKFNTEVFEKLLINFETPNSVEALAITVEVLGYTFPPIFTVVSNFLKTPTQIAFFQKLSAFNNKLKEFIDSQDLKRMKKYSEKSRSVILLISLLTIFYFIMLSLLQVFFLKLGLEFVICSISYTIFSTLCVLICVFLILLVNFLTTCLKFSSKIKKTDLKTCFKMCAEFNQLIDSFNEAFGLIYIGCYLHAYIDFGINLYYFYGYLVFSERSLLSTLSLNMWTVVPLFSLYYLGHCSEKLNALVSFKFLRKSFKLILIR